MSDRSQTEGRRGNAAEPLGDKKGVSSPADVERTGRKGPKHAGPDGPDPTEASKVAR